MSDDPILAFRKNNDLVGQAREALSQPIMQRMLLITRDAGSPPDAPVTAPEVASVRALSQYAGWTAALSTLLSLSVPHSDLPDTPDEDWGTQAATE